MANRLPNLDYSPRASWYRRKRTIHIAFFLGVAVTMVLSGPFFWRSANRQYWQYRCLHNEPSEQTVYTSQPLQDADQVVGNPIAVGIYPLPRPNLASGASFDCWRQLKSWDPGISSNPPEEPIYVHQRICLNGNKRLIVINMTVSEAIRISQYSGKTISVSVYFRPQVMLANKLTATTEVGPKFSSIGKVFVAKGRVKVFAGQSDPTDLSRFFIKYTADDEIGTLEGRLLDNDTIEFGSTTKNFPP